MQFRIIMTNLRVLVKKFLPLWADGMIRFLIYTNYFDLYLILTAGTRHHYALKRVISKQKLNVVFFAFERTAWKYDQLYKFFEQDERFQPAIAICPFKNCAIEIMVQEMARTSQFLTAKNFNVVKTYNEQTGEWLDVKKVLQPDIIFFTNPHKLTKDDYYITNYINYLTCYLPYTFQISNLYELQYNQLFHNLIWKAFYPTNIHQEMARKYARNRGRNVVISGYSGTDLLQDKSYTPKDSWKIKSRDIKRIIWAPHHTIDNDTGFLAFSNFLVYHQEILNIAIKYAGKIQIAFKPHPFLRTKLILEKDWGIEKTDAYYSKWDNLPNGQLESSDYADLFLTSDAMIHDSSSFMAEYLAVNKPVLFTLRDPKIPERLNSIGKRAFEQHYHAYSANDIIRFIEDTVINGNDVKKDQREAFVSDYIKTPNDVSATMNIYKYINEKLKA